MRKSTIKKIIDEFEYRLPYILNRIDWSRLNSTKIYAKFKEAKERCDRKIDFDKLQIKIGDLVEIEDTTQRIQDRGVKMDYVNVVFKVTDVYYDSMCKYGNEPRLLYDLICNDDNITDYDGKPLIYKGVLHSYLIKI